MFVCCHHNEIEKWDHFTSKIDAPRPLACLGEAEGVNCGYLRKTTSADCYRCVWLVLTSRLLNENLSGARLMRIFGQCAASSGDGVAASAGFFRPHSARPWTKT